MQTIVREVNEEYHATKKEIAKRENFSIFMGENVRGSNKPSDFFLVSVAFMVNPLHR